MKRRSLLALLRLLEFSDSAFPAGAFSFSNGVETAAERGIITDGESLCEYARDMARRSAFTDGVAALRAMRSTVADDYAGVCEADEMLWLSRLNDESRLMTSRMGTKTAELADRILHDDAAWGRWGSRWLADIRSGSVRGTHAATLGLVFALCGLSERELFASLHYGALNVVLGAALRCVRVSHYDTQRILFTLSGEADGLYAEAASMELDDMNSFSPQADILAALHEKGTKRMFMN